MFTAYSGNYKKKVKEQQLSSKVQNAVVVFGKAGNAARGIVIGVIAFLTFLILVT